MPIEDEKILAWIASCDDPKRLQEFVKNAKKSGRNDLRNEALKRAWRLAGLTHADELDRDFYSMLAAYEEYLFEKHGKRVKASYTWRALKNKGVMATLEDWALSPKATPGFLSLIEAGLPEFTGECVVVRHADRFPDSVVAAARKRLEEYGVTNCSKSKND